MRQIQQFGTFLCVMCGLSACDSGLFAGTPYVDQVLISPDNPTAEDTLVCRYDGFVGGEDASEVSWTINGQDQSTGTQLAEGFARGDEVTCSVVPSNGKKSGDVQSSTVIIGNAAPALSNVLLSPLEPTTLDSLTCSFDEPTDIDGDTDFSFDISWAVNDGRISASGEVLDGSLFERADSVQCFVTVSDGETSSVEVASNTVTVLNTAPSVEGVYIDPPNPLPIGKSHCV